MTSRITIIGSGITAAAAALEALQHGAHVTVISGQPGATALSSGTWDVAALSPPTSASPWNEIPSAMTCMEQLLRFESDHPYSLIQKKEDPISFVGKALERLSSELSLHLRGSLRQPFLALTPLGTPKVTAYVGPMQSTGNLLDMREARLLLVGFCGLGTYFPSLAEAVLKRQLSTQKEVYLKETKSTLLSLREFRFLGSPMDLALRLDQESRQDRFYDQLIDAAEQFRATHVALPPVMGLEQSNHLMTRLRENSAIKWFEMPGTPPSLPGLRLHRQIEKFFKGGRIDYLEGEVKGAATHAKRISHLELSDGKRIEVQNLILATGRYIGGGLTSDEILREPILNLPLFSQGKRVDGTKPSRLTSPDFLSSHPLFEAGVRVGAHFQPVDQRGHLLHENLWAAGSLLTGYQEASQGCGMGVAVATGMIAGRFAAC
ncbi:MAG: anaerobic glycerol-3-phosphate dehydrogenase subunit B [Deltaproteobacteria bacterium]|nr:anaerobic glycerol-3-phosphate dehydrogenase subunit B [Deltaproteobacteria bacterium]